MCGDTLGGVMVFPDGFDAFWALQTPIWVLDHLHEASRCPVACKGGFGDVFGQSGVKNHPKKKFPNVFRDTVGGYL